MDKEKIEELVIASEVMDKIIGIFKEYQLSMDMIEHILLTMLLTTKEFNHAGAEIFQKEKKND